MSPPNLLKYRGFSLSLSIFAKVVGRVSHLDYVLFYLHLLLNNMHSIIHLDVPHEKNRSHVTGEKLVSNNFNLISENLHHTLISHMAGTVYNRS